MLRRMLLTSAMVGLLVSAPALSKCYLKEITATNSQGTISSMKDVERTIFPWKNGRKCVVEFNALVKGDWHRGYGDKVFGSDTTEDVACTSALKNGKTDLLNELFPQQLSSDHVLVCDEQQKAISNKPVPELQNNPDKPHAFGYKGRWCRWFFHTAREGTDLYQWNVIGCLIPNQTDEVSWEVVDMF
jgi:hypothetical protein